VAENISHTVTDSLLGSAVTNTPLNMQAMAANAIGSTAVQGVTNRLAQSQSTGHEAQINKQAKHSAAVANPAPKSAHEHNLDTEIAALKAHRANGREVSAWQDKYLRDTKSNLIRNSVFHAAKSTPAIPYSFYDTVSTPEKVAMGGLAAGAALLSLPETLSASAVSILISGLEVAGNASMAAAGVPVAEGAAAAQGVAAVGGGLMAAGASQIRKTYNGLARYNMFSRGRAGGSGAEGEQLILVGSSNPQKYSMTSDEVRVWYHQQLDAIYDRVNCALPLRDQALKAYKLRNEIKYQARDLMSDRVLARNLPEPKTLKDVVRNAYKRDHLVGGDVWRYVLNGSSRSNSKVDDALGISRKFSRSSVYGK
jgi:hypothetical protein